MDSAHLSALHISLDTREKGNLKVKDSRSKKDFRF